LKNWSESTKAAKELLGLLWRDSSVPTKQAYSRILHITVLNRLAELAAKQDDTKMEIFYGREIVKVIQKIGFMDEDTKAMALRNFAITLWKKGSPEATQWF